MSRTGPGWDHTPTEKGFNCANTERVQGVRDETRAMMMAASFENVDVVYTQTRW